MPPHAIWRAALAALVLAAVLTSARRADACISGPGNGTAETGDCLDTGLSFGPKGDMIAFLSVMSGPALAFDGKAMSVGLRRMSTAWKIVGIVGGTVTLALVAGYLVEFGFEDGGMAVTIVGGAVGVPALVGGVVGLALGDHRGEPLPSPGLVRCAARRCGVAVPVPRVSVQEGRATVVVPVLGGRW